MPLTCGDGGDYDWYHDGGMDITYPWGVRRKRCESCNEQIQSGADCTRFCCWRPPNTDIEERIHGEEVPMACKYHCERCQGLYESLMEIGYGVLLGEEMIEHINTLKDIKRENGGVMGCEDESHAKYDPTAIDLKPDSRSNSQSVFM